MTSDYITLQQQKCLQFGAIYYPTSDDLKIGVSRNLRGGMYPVNGLRVTPNPETSGWYIWAGEELSQAEDFFVPLHATHISTWRSDVLPYLGLPPGWRFLLAPSYEDVWYDSTLLSG